MPERKPAPRGAASPFTSADRLMKEDRSKSENERRLERWAEAMVRERRLDPSWKDDRDAAVTVRWIGDRNATPPPDKVKKSPGKKV
jgi:hypothetical protein